MYVGWEFGSWLNQTFELDKKIGDLIDKMRGIDPAMNGLGGVAAGPGLDPKGDQHLGDGTIKRADGTIKAYGYKVASKWAGPQFGAPSPLQETDAIEAARAALRNKLGKPQFSPQVVGPEERAAASQHTETEKTELVIKDETGRAELTKKPTGKRTRIRLEPTGGF